MAKKPRKPHTSRKRIITPETRTKIARALAAKLGPTSDWDKPEPTGRKTNGIDKTTGHKITISTPKRTLTKPKTPPNPNTIHNPNGTKAGGHRASTHYLNTQKITQEPLAQERLTERANTLTTPQKVTKYLDKLDQRLKTANTDTGNPETNRQNQRLALKHLVEAQLLGLVNPNGEQINDTPTWKPNTTDTTTKENTTAKTPKQPWHPKTHGTYTPQQQEQEHKNPAAPGGIIHTEAKNLTPLQLKRLANHYGLTDENIINQLGVQAGNPKFRKTQAFNTTYDKWLLDKLGTKLGVTNRQELDTKLTELNGGKDPHKTMISPIMFQTATPELRQLIEQELGYLPSRRNMERDKAGQPKPHPRAGLKISQKRTKQETDARDLAALKADQHTIRKQETQAKTDTEKQRIINRRATHQRDEYQANQDDTAKALQHAHRDQQLGKRSRFSQETKDAEAKFNAEHPIDSYRPLAQKILDTEWENYKQGNHAPVSINAQKGRPTNPSNTAIYAKAAEENGGFPNADLKKKLKDLESNTATRHIRRGEAGVKVREARKKLRELTSKNLGSESTEEVRKLKLEGAQHEAKLRKQLETFWKEQKRTLKMEGATDKDLEYVNGKLESATRVSKQAEKNLAKYSETPKPTRKEPPRTNWKTNLTTNDPNTPLENQARNLSDNDLITAYKGLKADMKYWEHHLKTRSTYTQREAITNRDKTLTQQISIKDELKQRGFKLNALNKGRQNGTTEAQMNAQRERKAHQAKLHNANVVNSIAIGRPEALTALNDTELTDWYNTINTLEKNYKPEDWAKVQKVLPTIHEEINRRGLGSTEQTNRKAQKAMSFDDDLIAAAKDPHADYIRENDILVPHKNYKVTTYKGDGAGKDNNYITNPNELISIALANTHNTKETNNLLKFRDRIDAGAPLWTDKNGTLHTTSKIDANTRINLETILETTGTTTDTPSWNDGIPQGRIHHDDLKARGWTSDMIWQNLEDVMKLKDVPEGTNKRTYSMREVEAVEATNKKIAKAVGDRAHLIPLAETPATSENTWGRTALKERGWTERMIERYLGEPDFYDRGYDNRPFYKWHKDRIKQAEAEDPALRRRIEQDEKKRQEKFDKLTEGGKGYFRRINGDWVIAGKDIKRGQTIIVRKKNGEEKKVYIGSVTTVDDTTYGVPGTPPVTLNQQAREIGKELPQPMSNKAKEHKVNTSPVTSKQISFINKLLARHSRNYGVIEGENLFLDSFTYKYPTQTELKKMTRSEASFLIDILQNDEM